MAQPLVRISPDATLQEAGKKMQEVDCGILPVGNGSKLEGIITDRDIVIRAVAQGKNPAKEKVRDYMTREVHICKESDKLDVAAEQMREFQVSRLIVEDDKGNISGILTFGSILRKDPSAREIAEVVECAVGEKAA